MAAILPAILALRRDPRLLRLPPYLSALLVLVGIIWLLLLPLDQYSRHTYISENALLPGQVHTYFGGSEQAVFNAYHEEIRDVLGKENETTTPNLKQIFQSADLKPATQRYAYKAAGRTFEGENVYAILRAPRGDATEAVVLAAATYNADGAPNINGAALVLTLARYFTRWSLWSKDIIILITPDSVAGPQAWVDAYHDEQNSELIEPLPAKSGALQGAIVVDDSLGHNFDKIHIVYDGINGQLPNLDLINTAVSIASGQMGIGIALQRMWIHNDSYLERLQTMLRGMMNQGVGSSHGVHSSFLPYHVDAITLQAVGTGPHDDMALGRVVESIFRSLNNLLEHFHQSFFFYLLMQADRFVSVGTYLPSAMLVAANFSITAIALWIRSGRPQKSATNPVSAANSEKSKMEVVEKNGMKAVVPAQTFSIVERHLFLPVLAVGAAHFIGLLPLYMFNSPSGKILGGPSLYNVPIYICNLNLAFPYLVKRDLFIPHTTSQQRTLIQCFSLLLLGMFLATLATLNFSLSLIVGLLATPLSFITPSLAANPEPSSSNVNDMLSQRRKKQVALVVLQLLSPPVVVGAISVVTGVGLKQVLNQASFGWNVNGMWTQVVVWCVWYPAWLVGASLVMP